MPGASSGPPLSLCCTADRGAPEGAGRNRPVRVMPDGLAALDQERLRALMLHVDPVGKGQGDGALLDDPDEGRGNSLRLRRGQEGFPLTVGSGRDRSGGGMLEQNHRPVCRLSKDCIEVGHGHELTQQNDHSFRLSIVSDDAGSDTDTRLV